MKVLDLALMTEENPNLSMREGVASLGDECVVFDWIKIFKERLAPGVNNELIEVCEDYRPDLIFMQIQAADVIYPSTIKRIKETCSPYIINWTGDVRQPLPLWYYGIGRIIDFSLFTNMTDVHAMKNAGLRADYLQVGFEHKIFYPLGEKRHYNDIVFLGSNYENVFPNSQRRKDMVGYLKNIFGEKFGVFGHNWNTSFLQPEDEARCYRGCKIAINQNHYHLPRFSSDRIFRIMGSGAFCLSYHYPEIEEEFTPGIHLDTWKTFDDLGSKIAYYLNHEEERKRIAEEGCDFVHSNYRWANRFEQLKKMI